MRLRRAPGLTHSRVRFSHTVPDFTSRRSTSAPGHLDTCTQSSFSRISQVSSRLPRSATYSPSVSSTVTFRSGAAATTLLLRVARLIRRRHGRVVALPVLGRALGGRRLALARLARAARAVALAGLA